MDLNASFMNAAPAGADCVYPISLRHPALLAQVVKELNRPVNVNPSEPLAALADAGAARISLGGGEQSSGSDPSHRIQ